MIKNPNRRPGIAFYSVGDENWPSTRFRVLQFFPDLDLAGFDVRLFALPRVNPGRLRRFLGMLWQAFVRWRQLGQAKKYDLVVVQKGLTPWRCRGLEKRLWESGRPYILDLDDAVYLINHVRLPGALRWLQDDGQPEVLLRRADHVIAGNAVLGDFSASRARAVSLIPTCIDTKRFVPPARVPAASPVIGWSGSISTNFYFNALIPVLRRLAGLYTYRLVLISDSLQDLRTSELGDVKWDFVRWNKETEVADLQKIDIGLMPLTEDPWSNGKCGMKALLYMSVGAPPVCSPVGVNREIVREGVNGFLAKDEEQWFTKLSCLIEDPALRQKMGRDARKTVEERYSVNQHFPKLLEIFRGLMASESAEMTYKEACVPA